MAESEAETPSTPGEFESKYFEFHGVRLPPFCRGKMEEIANFPVRPSDVWIVTYPKSGTSLLQEVVYLVSQGADPDEIGLMNIDEQLPVLEYPQPGLDIIKELTSPRLIKSHLPYRFLPSDLHNGDSKVIYMARNPKDLVVSYYQFHRSLRTMSYRGTFQEFCRRFMNDKRGTPSAGLLPAGACYRFPKWVLTVALCHEDGVVERRMWPKQVGTLVLLLTSMKPLAVVSCGSGEQHRLWTLAAQAKVLTHPSLWRFSHELRTVPGTLAPRRGCTTPLPMGGSARPESDPHCCRRGPRTVGPREELTPTPALVFQDLVTMVEQLARFLGVSCDKTQLEALTEHCHQLVDQCCNAEALPVGRGRVGLWKDIFTVSMNEKFDLVYKQKMGKCDLTFDFYL
ncbi:sulfotransferase 4A1 [Theropithecus gelada]|uniref:sulfotransferase 4A1 n=1 Tax=Theropithecus gelada TaxID=9565 RepID=UPI000DC186B8|nr:sulfotransferase 4A1 [Theropithecus gelada]